MYYTDEILSVLNERPIPLKNVTFHIVLSTGTYLDFYQKGRDELNVIIQLLMCEALPLPLSKFSIKITYLSLIFLLIGIFAFLFYLTLI